MTNEEFEKTKEFILQQQAQFTSDMQQLREAQAKTDQVVTQTVEIVGRLANGTLEGFKDVNAKIDALVNSQIRTDETIKALTDFGKVGQGASYPARGAIRRTRWACRHRRTASQFAGSA